MDSFVKPVGMELCVLSASFFFTETIYISGQGLRNIRDTVKIHENDILNFWMTPPTPPALAPGSKSESGLELLRVGDTHVVSLRHPASPAWTLVLL